MSAPSNAFALPKWTRRTHPRTGVAVYTITISRYTESGSMRHYDYRIAPDDLRTGGGPWRADRYDMGIPEACTPEGFESFAKALEWLRDYHSKRVSAE